MKIENAKPTTYLVPKKKKKKPLQINNVVNDWCPLQHNKLIFELLF